MSIVARKRGENPIPDNIKIFEAIWDCFIQKNWIKMLILELKGAMICAGLIFTFGDTVSFWKYGRTGKEGKSFPTQLLYWELIRWSKNNGFKYFDIVQVDPVVIGQLEAGLQITEEIKSRRLYRITFFKTVFGGKVLKYSGTWFRFKKPIFSFFTYYSVMP